MNKTKIDWCDYTWNPITGCKRGCSFCYAKRINDRFSQIPYSKIIFHESRLFQPLKEKKPSKIFIGSMSDIEYWNTIDMEKIFVIIRLCPQHTFLFLTKNGDVYAKYNFPENCWLGVSSTNGDYKFNIQKNRIKFLSLEPLLEQPTGLWLNPLIDWLIIGGLTPKPQHKKEWVDEILLEARRLKVPVFIKHNADYPEKIQELPVLTELTKEK